MFLYYTIRKIIKFFMFLAFIFFMFHFFGGTGKVKDGVESISQQTQQIAAIPQDIQAKINQLNVPAPLKDVFNRVKNLDPTGEEGGGSDNTWGY